MDEPKRPSILPGVFLIILGVIFLLGNMGAFKISPDVFWAIIVILIGAIFWVWFLLDRTRVTLLMPGTVLITIGIVFYYCAATDWEAIKHLWPFFILAPAFGFYMMYLFGKREPGILIPAGILTVIGVVQILQSFDWGMRYIWPSALIVIGAILLLRNARQKTE